MTYHVLYILVPTFLPFSTSLGKIEMLVGTARQDLWCILAPTAKTMAHPIVFSFSMNLRSCVQMVGHVSRTRCDHLPSGVGIAAKIRGTFPLLLRNNRQQSTSLCQTSYACIILSLPGEQNKFETGVVNFKFSWTVTHLSTLQLPLTYNRWAHGHWK